MIPARPVALSAFGILSAMWQGLLADATLAICHDPTQAAGRAAPQSGTAGQSWRRVSQAGGGGAEGIPRGTWRGALHFERSLTCGMRSRLRTQLARRPGRDDRIRTRHRALPARTSAPLRYNHPDGKIELVTLRLRASLPTSQPQSQTRLKVARQQIARKALTNACPCRTRTRVFDGKAVSTPVFERGALSLAINEGRL